MKSTPELLAECLAKTRVQALLIGGLALEAYGYGRQTYDLDILVAAPDVDALEHALVPAGYSRKAATENFRRYVATSVYQAPLDVLLVDGETFRKMMAQSRVHDSAGVGLRVPSLLHLVALKLHAIKNNPAREARDLGDVAALLAANPGGLSDADVEAVCDAYGPPGIRSRLEGIGP